MKLTRRTALGSGLAGLILMNTNSFAASGDPVVETSQGRFRGQIRSGALAFLGIRYAMAERFRAPRRAPGHAGIVDALAFGASAPQTNPAPPAGPPQVILGQLPRPAGAAPPVRIAESEDCLFLNIWTSATGHDRKRPVMVWLHGGFFSGGSGSTVDGSALAARGDVVVVSLNHRLNAFGFTAIDHPDYRDSGNVGMLDIISALNWIAENIAAFGGDPRRVTVMGTSGGGMKTAFLAASPLSKGLMHRMAMHSGPVLEFLASATAMQATDLLLRTLDASPGDIDRLLKADPKEMLAAYHRVSAQLPARRFTHLPCFAPIRDGRILPANPFSPAAAPGLKGMPLLIGSNSDDMSFFMGNDPGGFTLDRKGYEARILEAAGERAGAIVALYDLLYPAMTHSQRWIRFHSDLSIKVPTMLVAQRKARLDGKVWRYRLDFPSPALDGKLGATHTLETPLIFNTPGGPLTGGGDAVRRLAMEMSETWVAFAREGKVSALDRAPGKGSESKTLLFDQRTHVEHGADREMFELLRPLIDD